MENSFAYLLLLTFFAVCAFQYEMTEDADKKERVVWLCMAVFFVFFGFRGYVYTDWTHYVVGFEYAEWSDFFDMSLLEDDDKEKITEPGFMLFLRLCKTICDNYTFFTVACTAVNMALLLRFVKSRNVENVPFIMMVFIAFWGLNLMFDLMRNTTAILIFANSLQYIEQRKPVPYFLMCLAALSFHLSSFIFFPLYFVAHLRINRWVFLGVFLGVFVFFLTHQSLIQILLKVSGLEGSYGILLEEYTEIYSSGRPFSIYITAEHFGLVTLVVLYYDDIIERFKGRVILLNMLLLYFIMFYILSDFYILSLRMSTLFVFAYWVLWYDVIKVLAVRRNKWALSSVLYLYCMFLLAVNNKGPVYQYDNVLFGAKSYEERLATFRTTFKDIGI